VIHLLVPIVRLANLMIDVIEFIEADKLILLSQLVKVASIVARYL
jgi:hypothetical protein